MRVWAFKSVCALYVLDIVNPYLCREVMRSRRRPEVEETRPEGRYLENFLFFEDFVI
jgi:hypothetical protein